MVILENGVERFSGVLFEGGLRKSLRNQLIFNVTTYGNVGICYRNFIC
jgi:hypothetical protein